MIKDIRATNYWLSYKDQTILVLSRAVEYLKKNPHMFTNNDRAWPLRVEDWSHHMIQRRPLFNFEAVLWLVGKNADDIKFIPASNALTMIRHLTINCNKVSQEPNEWAKDKSVQEVIELIEFAIQNYDEYDRMFKFSKQEQDVQEFLYGPDDDDDDA